MKLSTEYDLKQVLYMMYVNKIRRVEVRAFNVLNRWPENTPVTTYTVKFLNRTDYYSEQIEGKYLFKTKEALLKTL